MEFFTTALFIVGLLVAFVGSIAMLIAAFRENLWWGLASLFLPLASLIFLILHWPRAKTGFFISLAGTLMKAGGALSSPHLRGLANRANTLDLTALQGQFQAASKPAPTIEAQLEEKRAKVEQMEGQFAQDGATLVKQFQQLTAKRAALKPTDAAAMAAFNTEVADYQARNTARKQARVDIDALRGEIEGLLVKRAQQQQQSNAKKVVIYTTSSCPACKVAKSYLAKKGVAYEEHDVNNSAEARAEFERLGGRGVPLILVGGERMEGFNRQRLDQLL